MIDELIHVLSKEPAQWCEKERARESQIPFNQLYPINVYQLVQSFEMYLLWIIQLFLVSSDEKSRLNASSHILYVFKEIYQPEMKIPLLFIPKYNSYDFLAFVEYKRWFFWRIFLTSNFIIMKINEERGCHNLKWPERVHKRWFVWRVYWIFRSLCNNFVWGLTEI